MAFEHRDNSGSLFKNDYKKADNHPDYKGKVLVNGKEMEIAAWIKEGRNGKFMSLSFSEPYRKDERQAESKNEFEGSKSASASGFGDEQFNTAQAPEDEIDIPF